MACDPVTAIKRYMKQHKLQQRDLIPFFGSKSRVSEVLMRRRPMTLEAIRRLHKHGVADAETLIRPIRLKRPSI